MTYFANEFTAEDSQRMAYYGQRVAPPLHCFLTPRQFVDPYQMVTDMSARKLPWMTAQGVPSPLPQLRLDHVEVSLANKELWDKFHQHQTEMIITKSGRRMFPSIQLSIGGLNRKSKYCIAIELVLASNRRHKYNSSGVNAPTDGSSSSSGGRVGNKAHGANSGGWTESGPAEPQPMAPHRFFLHQDSPASGAHWMQQPVNFSRLKLTNNSQEQQRGNVLLTSMHKYIPRIWVVECDHPVGLEHLSQMKSAVFTFPETEFIAVTAYQNEAITELKIYNNPFAKGFRETGQSACKRKRLRLGHDGNDPAHKELAINDSNNNSNNDNNSSSSSSSSNNSITDREEDEAYIDVEENNGSTSSDWDQSEPSPKRHCYEPQQQLQPQRGDYEESVSSLQDYSHSEPGTPESSEDRASAASSPAASPPAEQTSREPRPKLYRPWAEDNEEEDTSAPITTTSPHPGTAAALAAWAYPAPEQPLDLHKPSIQQIIYEQQMQYLNALEYASRNYMGQKYAAHLHQLATWSNYRN